MMNNGKSQQNEFYGRKALIVGLGISGLSTAKWLVKQDADVIISEIKPEAEILPGVCKEVRELGVMLEAGGHSSKTFSDAETIIISPGVPHDMDLLKDPIKRGVPVMGELEFASRLIDTPMIAVTGTNGKSTVTTFLECMLENAGLDVFAGGNIGTPLMEYVSEDKKVDYVVVEVSSFQLDTIDTFHPLLSIVLNISPDHLSRYSSYEDYVHSKLRIFENQKAGEYVMLNDDDERLSSVSLPCDASVFRYGLEAEENRNAFIEGQKAKVCMDGRENSYFSLESYSLPGRHNIENLLATVLAGKILGAGDDAIQRTLDEFKGLPNRLENVGEINGVAFYNDSKATNVDSAV
ncbi:MAG: UDP-N-acetylmuramoyl-L-alanine--D-glutamate ligase, partial [Desulfobacterales bacterium]|nr:UDP-N-acetylmuramoyl-L-alanine--D-glutamate ligase [Desulfobacterales bacterium]